MTPSQLFVISNVTDALQNFQKALKNAQSEGITCILTLENKDIGNGEIRQDYGVQLAIPKSKPQDSSVQNQSVEQPAEEPAV